MEQNDLIRKIDDSTSAFDELMNLLDGCVESEQLSLDDRIEIGQLQLQTLEIKNFGLTQSIKMKDEFKNNLTKKSSKWSEMNSQLDRLIELMSGLKCDVDLCEIRLQIEFEKKMNYLNFLLESAKKSMTVESLRKLLSQCNREENGVYSIALREHHFELNAVKNVKYDLDGLSKLAQRVEEKLDQLGVHIYEKSEPKNHESKKIDFDTSQAISDIESEFTSMNTDDQPTKVTEELDERFAFNQLSKVISNIKHLKSITGQRFTESNENLLEKSINKDPTKQLPLNFLPNKYHLDQLNESPKCSLPSTEKSVSQTLQQISTGLEEFTDDLPDDFFKGVKENAIPCSQLAVNRTKDSEKSKEDSDSEDNRLIIDENIELDLSIGSKASRALNIDYFYQPPDQRMNTGLTQFINLPNRSQSRLFNPLNYEPSKYEPSNYKPLNYEPSNYKPLNYEPSSYEPSNYHQSIKNFQVDLSSSSDRFFTDQSDESVIKKVNKNIPAPIRTLEKVEEEDDLGEFGFQTSLSSQINFN